MENQEIKNKIWSNLDKLRADLNFSGFRDTKILALIGTTLGSEKLDFIFEDKELLLKMAETFSITAPTYVFNFIQELTKSENNKSFFDPCSWKSIEQ